MQIRSPPSILLKQFSVILCLSGRRFSPWRRHGGCQSPMFPAFSPLAGDASKHKAGAKLFAPVFVRPAYAAALCDATT